MNSSGDVVGSDYTGEKTKVADSRKEYRRRCELIAEERAGLIHNLQCQGKGQRRFWLHSVNGERVCQYVPDFVYVRNGKLIVEDVKPMRKVKGKFDAKGDSIMKPFATPVYYLKKKFFEAEYKLVIQEV